jgi:hypothetical protein
MDHFVWSFYRVSVGDPPLEAKYLEATMMMCCDDVVMQVIHKLASAQPEYCTLALKTFLRSEVQSRNPANMRNIQSVVAAMHAHHNGADTALALLLQEIAVREYHIILYHNSNSNIYQGMHAHHNGANTALALLLQELTVRHQQYYSR